MPSARELQIIRMLADGMETDAISQALSLSRYTVATYLKRACDKLGARNRANLIAVCERRGLL
ncbi:response regulator transcription factor [Bifidobacterium avesanii]|nr:helix-turn-helix transcriptional regulator [Bifidobacterium avesanii]